MKQGKQSKWDTIFRVLLVVAAFVSFLNLMFLESDLEAIRAGMLGLFYIYVLRNWE